MSKISTRNTDMNREASSLPLDRRAFLTASGALVVTLAAAAELSPPAQAAAPTGAATRPPLTGDQLSSYITIEPDGTVLAYYGKIDGGQGLGTSIAQMVAEEIDVPFEQRARGHGRQRPHPRHGRGERRHRGLARRHGAAPHRGAGAPSPDRARRRRARPAGRAAHRDRRRGACRRRPHAAHLLCAADRRALFRRQGGLERQDLERARGRRQGAVEDARPVQGHRQIVPPPRSARQGVRHARHGQRHAAARHAACAHDPPAGRGRGAGQGRRKLDRADSGRPSGLDQGPARGRGQEGMERRQGGRRPSR